jgi:pimeloyl-ACP methyl ester carboxylesterase
MKKKTMTASSRIRQAVMAAVFLCPLIAGCAPRAIEPTGQPRHVVCLPGILGRTPGFNRIPRIVDRELEGASVQVWDWTRIDPHWLPNPVGHIRDYEKNRKRARLLADQITRFRRQHPDVPLSIVALSGGTAIALFACEELPEDVKLDRIILLSAAVSPDYDLGPSLRHADNGIVSYFSPKDRLILKRGTRWFGTGDRVYIESAGFCGFNRDRACGQNCDQLTEIGWRPALWKQYRNSGGHAGAQEKRFIRNCVVRWLKGDLAACSAASEAPQTNAAFLSAP